MVRDFLETQPHYKHKEETAMKKYYIKTEQEFIEEFGEDWRKSESIDWNPDGQMDHLFGQEVKTDEFHRFNHWNIYPNMIKTVDITNVQEISRPLQSFGGIVGSSKIEKHIIGEKEMEKEKFMFENEEHFKKVANDIFGITVYEKDVNRAKDKGYIRKSELETLVEEAEAMLYEHFKCHTERVEDLRMCNEYLSQANKIIKQCDRAIEALKTEVNRLGGKV